jgi:hypothetical protein
MILILKYFKAHKLDISDEFRAVIEALRGHDDKIRCILNKADQVMPLHFFALTSIISAITLMLSFRLIDKSS